MIKKAELQKTLALAQIQLIAANLEIRKRDNVIRLVDTQLGNMIYNLKRDRVIPIDSLLRSLEAVVESMHEG